MTGTEFKTSFSRLKNQDPKFNKRCKFLNVFLVVAIAMCGAYYVALVNDLTIKGIKVQELKRQKTSMQQENRNLNVRVTSLKSYQNITQRTQKIRMVSVNNVDYIRVHSGVLAQK